MTSTLPLISRISTPCKHLAAPGPDRERLMSLLAEAVHVPDHGRLRPWRFILIEGEARARIGKVLFERVQSAVPDASAVRLEKERTR